MRKNELTFDNIYHVYNRGVEKRKLFMDDADYQRFVDGLIIFNDANPILNPKQRAKDIKNGDHERNGLVDILTFCLMPNHFHLLLRQKKEGGITEFMRKLGVGYANYFNTKHKRVGSLFQGNFKSVLIGEESQFLYIPFYIHLNPLDLINADWQKRGVTDFQKATKFLDAYKWSGHLDYAGKSDLSLILQKDFLKSILGRSNEYKRDFYSFVNDFNFSDTDTNSKSFIDLANL